LLRSRPWSSRLKPLLDQSHHSIEEEADEPDREDAQNDVLVDQAVVLLPEKPTNAGSSGEHLGGHDHQPGDTEAQPKPGEHRRQRRGEKHFEQRQKLKKFFDKRKERLVVKKGFSNVLLRMEDIVLFYTESRVVYVLDKEGKRYMCDQNLAELETLLDNHTFFRANRQYIVNIQFIRGYKTLERVKLAVDVNCSESNHSIIVIQETAPYCRKWINEN